MSIYCQRFKKTEMKTFIYKSVEGLQSTGTLRVIRSNAAARRLFSYSLQLILLYVLVFAALSTLAQEPAVASREPGKLEFVKESAVYNTGKVYLNWVAKGNSTDCI